MKKRRKEFERSFAQMAEARRDQGFLMLDLGFKESVARIDIKVAISDNLRRKNLSIDIENQLSRVRERLALDCRLCGITRATIFVEIKDSIINGDDSWVEFKAGVFFRGYYFCYKACVGGDSAAIFLLEPFLRKILQSVGWSQRYFGSIEVLKTEAAGWRKMPDISASLGDENYNPISFAL